MQLFIIKRQIIKGVHSSRRQVYEYLYSQGGVWGERRDDADKFTFLEVESTLLHFRKQNEAHGSVLSTTKEKL